MDTKQVDTNKQQTQTQRKPDERGGILVQSHIKIFDPKTKEVFVNGRA
jgi:hypothetical protein